MPNLIEISPVVWISIADTHTHTNAMRTIIINTSIMRKNVTGTNAFRLKVNKINPFITNAFRTCIIRTSVFYTWH